ncbi:MAG: hypothetical protein ACTS2F_09820 [Thainema sp.]
MLNFIQKIVHWLDGTYITDETIFLRQSSGWIQLSRSEVYSVKFKSVSRVVVRLSNGQRLVLNLFGLNNPAYDRVVEAFRKDLQLVKSGRISTYERDSSK